MKMKTRIGAALAIAGAAMCTAAANADVVIATMTYDDLSGRFTQTSGPGFGNFFARAVDTEIIRSSGDVSRHVGVPATAAFPHAFKGGATVADFQIHIDVAQFASNMATGSGTFIATDHDGDTITGDITGTWIGLGAGFIAFNGELSNVFFNDNGDEDDTFNGIDGAGFQLSNWGAEQPFIGALVQLTFGAPSFFQGDFDHRATGVTAQILPTPGALALMGLGGIMLRRRRR